MSDARAALVASTSFGVELPGVAYGLVGGSSLGAGALAVPRPVVTFEDQYRPLLDHAYYVGLRFFGGDHHMAQEVAQETLTRAYERWARVSGHARPEAWVMNAAWKVSLELERKRARRLPYQVEAEQSDEQDRIATRPLLGAALAKLTRRQRNVVMARHYFGYDLSQTAELLAMSESGVKAATHEATTKLRRLLGEELVDRP